MEAEAGGWGRSLQWWSCPLCVIEQWHLASMVAWLSSAKFSSCGAPHSLPFRMSPHSKWYPLPEFSLQGPLFNTQALSIPGDSQLRLECTGRASQTKCISPTLFCLPQTGCSIPLQSPSLSQLILLLWGDFSECGNLSFPSPLPPPFRGAVLFPLIVFFFLSSWPVLWGFFLSF